MSEYLTKRLKEIGATEKNIVFKAWDDQHDKYLTTVFFEDSQKPEEGIRINYFSPAGNVCKYEKDKRKFADFYRVRLMNPNGSGKYKQPYETHSIPFITPGIIDKYKKKEKITTLIVVEGEIKAFAGNQAGMDIIGIGGIHNFKEAKGVSDIHHYIIDIIKTCQVKNVILLHDADAISENQIGERLEKNEDLATRLYSFYSSVKAFRELTKDLNIDVYYSQIKSEYESKAKGLDDLLHVLESDTQGIVNDILKLTKAKHYFFTLNVSDNNLNTLYKHFKLDLNSGRPESFYKAFQAIIGSREFIFNSITYQHENGALLIKKHPAALKYMRVGTDYYQHGYTFSKKREKSPAIIKWKKGEINVDHGNIKHFLGMIPKYLGFVNVPDNTGKYEQIIEGCYNRYYKLEHQLAPGGTHEATINFLKHIFGKYYDVGIDYLTILYRYPYQNLPVLCLVSKLRDTGKSTFLFWLKAVFGYNAIILGNEDFSSNFNSLWASKLLICVDETFIDKKIVLEKVKRLCTDSSINQESKGKDQVSESFIGKFILNSNNEDNFINIEDEENRFFVINVPVPEKRRNDLLNEMKEEIPSFLHFLSTRKITHPNVSRLWFQSELYKTEALRKVVLSSRSVIEKEMINYFSDIYNYLPETESEIKFTPKMIKEQIEKQLKNYNGLQTHIERILRDNWRMSPGKNSSFDFPYLDIKDTHDGGGFSPINNTGKELVLKYINVKGQYYIMTREQINEISN